MRRVSGCVRTSRSALIFRRARILDRCCGDTAESRRDQLRTFSVTFDRAAFDESAFQREMADRSWHRAVALACGDQADGGTMFAERDHGGHERPILRTAPAPLISLSGLVAAAGYKVVLTGEGADEVFAGYDI